MRSSTVYASLLTLAAIACFVYSEQIQSLPWLINGVGTICFSIAALLIQAEQSKEAHEQEIAIIKRDLSQSGQHIVCGEIAKKQLELTKLKGTLKRIISMAESNNGEGIKNLAESVFTDQLLDMMKSLSDLLARSGDEAEIIEKITWHYSQIVTLKVGGNELDAEVAKWLADDLKYLKQMEQMSRAHPSGKKKR